MWNFVDVVPSNNPGYRTAIGADEGKFSNFSSQVNTSSRNEANIPTQLTQEYDKTRRQEKAHLSLFSRLCTNEREFIRSFANKSTRANIKTHQVNMRAKGNSNTYVLALLCISVTLHLCNNVMRQSRRHGGGGYFLQAAAGLRDGARSGPLLRRTVWGKI